LAAKPANILAPIDTASLKQSELRKQFFAKVFVGGVRAHLWEVITNQNILSLIQKS
jgi:hypothetical protein